MQNAESEAFMESFKNIMPQGYLVIRDGKEQTILSQKLVVGDIVCVKSGDKVPADIRILSSNEMNVVNSPFTCEAEPLLRTIECLNLNPFARKDKAVKTPPLRQEIDRSFIYCSQQLYQLFFCSYYNALYQNYSNYGINNSLHLGIVILTANFPESLLGSLTISLAIAAKSIHSKNVQVKKIKAVETLGSTSCICSDKTQGTLTQNVMTVEHMWYDRKTARAINKSKITSYKVLEYNENDPCFQALHKAAIHFKSSQA
ncbi:hypothetical protein ABPG72_019858 [Tetrahymena utriculariae]